MDKKEFTAKADAKLGEITEGEMKVMSKYAMGRGLLRGMISGAIYGAALFAVVAVGKKTLG